MIPKALYLTFLSWRQPQTPAQGTGDTLALLTQQSSSAVPHEISSPFEQIVSNDHVAHSVQATSHPDTLDVEVELSKLANTFTFTVSAVDERMMHLAYQNLHFASQV